MRRLNDTDNCGRTLPHRNIHANIIFTHGRSLNRIENTHFKALADKKANKVVTVVCRCLKTYDDAVLVKWCQFRKQQIEAIIVICAFERFNEYLAVGRNRSGEMVKFGNINADVNYEIVPPFHKV